MVQQKDAAKKQQQRKADFLREQAERLQKSTIRFRWAVNEHNPGYNTVGYYDTDVPAKNRIVSPFFDSEEEAVEWMDRHEPDEGNSLNVVRHRLVKREWTEWVSY